MPVSSRLPEDCAASLTFCDVGENGVGMEKIGQDTNKPVSVAMLKAMKSKFEYRHVNGEPAPGVAELYDLSQLMEGVNVKGATVREAGVLVMRNFADHILGEGSLATIESEVQSMHEQGFVDSKALFRGVVKNKNARHNNVIADFTQSPDYALGRGTVVPFAQYEGLSKMRNAAAEWMGQENPMVCEQNRYFNTAKCGIGWHGDAERRLVWGVRVGDATSNMPLMFQAFHRHEQVGPKTTIQLNPGDVYVMSEVAVGRDWKSSSLVTWRHAAGSLTCPYSKDKKRKREE